MNVHSVMLKLHILLDLMTHRMRIVELWLARTAMHRLELPYVLLEVAAVPCMVVNITYSCNSLNVNIVVIDSYNALT